VRTALNRAARGTAKLLMVFLVSLVPAAGAGCTDGDTGIIVVPPPPPTLTAVDVAPPAVTLLPGAQQQFGATGRYSDGSSRSVAPTWEATGGTITSGGLFTAGTNPGTFQVTGRVSGRAGASTVTVTEPPPPPPIRLFDEETFGGNGRTCVTCHEATTGTITLGSVAARHAANPSDALFRHDGLDDGLSGTVRIRAHATIRVEIPLPAHVSIQGNPGQRSVVLHRGVPTTLDGPALDGTGAAPSLMLDLRHSSLEEQALGAIRGHAQNTVEPTAQNLLDIAAVQRLNPRFFSSPALFQFATAGGAAPTLPDCETPSECRGRVWFENVPVASGSAAGRCSACHSGPLLNEVRLNFTPVAGVTLRPGAKFGNVLVAETNPLLNPVRTFLVSQGGDTRAVALADPGIMLTHPLPPSVTTMSSFLHPAQLAGFFKTPTLRNLRNTAPYFHDNSAKTLREVVDHYIDVFFPATLSVGAVTPQDRDDLVAFLRRF
jgi:hypothetical protein